MKGLLCSTSLLYGSYSCFWNFLSTMHLALLPNMLLTFFDVAGSKKMILGEMINFARESSLYSNSMMLLFNLPLKSQAVFLSY